MNNTSYSSSRRSKNNPLTSISNYGINSVGSILFLFLLYWSLQSSTKQLHEAHSHWLLLTGDVGSRQHCYLTTQSVRKGQMINSKCNSASGIQKQFKKSTNYWKLLKLLRNNSNSLNSIKSLMTKKRRKINNYIKNKVEIQITWILFHIKYRKLPLSYLPVPSRSLATICFQGHEDKV